MQQLAKYGTATALFNLYPRINNSRRQIMKEAPRRLLLCARWLFLVSAWVLVPRAYAGNQVLGEIQFEGKSKVEKTSGVWVDGDYVGYLKELKGSKKLLLLPGDHVISVRQNGYQDFTQRVTLRPGQKQLVFVAMMKAPTGTFPALWS